jgi:hypothetical protein
MDPHHFGYLDPHSNKIRTRIRINVMRIHNTDGNKGLPMQPMKVSQIFYTKGQFNEIFVETEIIKGP